MKVIKWVGPMLVAVVAFGSIAASSGSASPGFLAHSNHSTGKLLASAGGNQVFTTSSGAIVCSALKLSQDATAGLQLLTVLVTVQYEGCEAFGIFAATIEPLQFLIDANGSVRMEGNSRILVDDAECSIQLSGLTNRSLTTVKFDNNANQSLLLLWGVDNLATQGTGAGCEYAEESNGKIEGKEHLSVETGSLKWDQNVPGPSTSRFLSHGTGKLLATADSALLFTAAFGNVECGGLQLAEGAVTLLSSKSLLVAIKYEKCTFFGGAATYHPFRYLINADGTVSLENTVFILVPAFGCTITLPSAGNQSLKGIKFDNKTNGVLLLLWQISGITSSGVGAGCAYEAESNGAFVNTMQISRGSGVLRWDP
jgi:hypothetical protein